MHDSDSDAEQYEVVVNDEDQYSIWRADQERPSGWRDAGKAGSKAECLAHIDRIWLDMRPRSLRVAMSESKT